MKVQQVLQQLLHLILLPLTAQIVEAIVGLEVDFALLEPGLLTTFD